ncbi:hypothetical protein [Chryseobacterium indologenes]|uniref:Uncharacterized protein n=1 Tax=Chryseobacterium indologenes TaxID=253 RepID=A0A0N0ZV40_CHRID|nr:hypothetical protein [Chryseobacterium indologenes]KPE50575.1 hypothetical protein AOB46_14445 [Chryseobacterium indologenes]
MKTTSNHQYIAVNSVLLFIVSMLLGYNIYQEIYHPEKSELLLCTVLVAITSAAIRRYGLKTDQEDQQKS